MQTDALWCWNKLIVGNLMTTLIIKKTMKVILKYAFCLSSITFIQTSCNNRSTKYTSNSEKIRKIVLTEKPIGESGYVISIPADYSITTSDGTDFLVYYFSPNDTTAKDKLSGGLYFGNFPSQFEADDESCKTETLKGKILDNNQNWTVHNCKEVFSIQTIAVNEQGGEWNQRVHAFGQAKSKDELQTILDIFSTLKKRHRR
jgi:hypothetical protein